MAKLKDGLGNKFVVAAIQLCSNEDKDRNLKLVDQFIENAIKDSASVVVLPEMFNCCGHTKVMVEKAEDIPGRTIDFLSDKARTHRIYIVCGSIFEKVGNSMVHNTSVLVGPSGEILAKYSKIHLFDVDIQGKIRYKESENVVAGHKIISANMGDVSVGLSICYDLRFCELFRSLALKGVKIIFIPSAFTSTTGEYHWEPLVRARAIENQVFVVAANQIGTSPNNITCYGKSMIVDPWGRVLANAKDNENVITAEIDLDLLDEVRTEIPLFEHRRTDLY
ncbi:MAG: carbon-nitrogen hydrolase family protein [Planctomycetota bacterium]|jgi:predicted amidohydrolase